MVRCCTGRKKRILFLEQMVLRKTVNSSTLLILSMILRNNPQSIMTIDSLSVLDNGKVKHYRLKKMNNGHYFVSRSKSFPTLKQLVEHYSKETDGLCTRLGEPCKKVKVT